MFNEEKTTYLACRILQQSEDNKCGYIKVIKLLYLIDRKMIELYDNVITGDRYVSMKYGPVLSNTLNLVKGNGACDGRYKDNYWDRYIETVDYSLGLDKTENKEFEDSFSKEENHVVNKIFEEHMQKTEWQLVDYTHDFKNCPEWQDPSPLGVVDLPLQRILSLMNKDEDVYRKLTYSDMLSTWDVL